MEAINSLAPAERAPSPVPIESPGSQTMDEDEEEEEDKETEHDDFDDLQYPIVEVKEAPPDEPSVFPVDNPQVLSRPFTLDSIFSIKRSESPKAAFSPSMSLATQLEACSLTTPPLRDQHEAPTQNTSPTTPQKPIFKKPAYPTPPRNEYTMFFYDLLETSINLLTSGEDMVGYECTLCLRDSKKSRGTFPEEVKPKILVEHYRNLHPNHYNKVVRGIRTQMK
ncbi:hypothetical protein FRC03_005580 [Tulasnella sp. 419]|nr:hypothetical protein FRC03_005580 [Tulasnella sp. 419]